MRKWLLKKLIAKLQRRWYKENQPIGKALGYPDCCIQEFCDQPPALLQIQSPGKTDQLRYEAGCIDGEFSGFVPCVDHAKQIARKEVTLESLIKDRSMDIPLFPNANADTDLVLLPEEKL